MDYIVHGVLQARILEWVAFPFSRGPSQPRSPTLQAASLPAEPPGKPKNTGVGSLSLLQWIFPTQESNRGLLHCRQIINWATREALARPRIMCASPYHLPPFFLSVLISYLPSVPATQAPCYSSEAPDTLPSQGLCFHSSVCSTDNHMFTPSLFTLHLNAFPPWHLTGSSSTSYLPTRFSPSHLLSPNILYVSFPYFTN